MKVNFDYLDFQVPVFFDWPDGVKYKVITKGRRTGITKGAANAFIEILLDGEGPILWGDTIHANIDRYFQRYFLPELKNNKIPFQWEAQKKQLTINNQFCDFRSADNPENWEGFGYKYIFLNEAGIILKNKELYVNTVLPMMLDYSDSKLIAAGVPKGVILKDGSEHPFYTLAKKADLGEKKYVRISLSSYDNPILNDEDIKELEDEIAAIGTDQAVRQEIYGEFIESDAVNPFATNYDKAFHESESVKFDYTKQIYIMVDFNLNPFAVTFWHHYQDISRYNWLGFDEASIDNGSLDAMAELIIMRYGPYLHSAILSGDSMGKNRNIALKDNASNYIYLQRKLGLSSHQVRVPHNPTHENSRTDTNELFWLTKQPNSKYYFAMNPNTMPNTCRDFRHVQVDAFGTIIKKNRKDLNQRADFIDTGRSFINLTAKPLLLRLRK